MSDTIQARHNSARQAALFQQRPGELIEAAENFAETMEPGYARLVIVGVGAAGRWPATALKANTNVVLTSTSWPTTAPKLLVDREGHQANDVWSLWVDQAKDALQNAEPRESRQKSAAARWRVESLSALQVAFGFTIQDLAAVLGITRPQLYKWLDAGNDINLQDASRARLSMMERIAAEWTKRSKAPLSPVSKEPLTAGGNVFALMAADVVNEEAVIGAFDELADKLHDKPKTRSQRLLEAGFTRRPSVRSLPSDE